MCPGAQPQPVWRVEKEAGAWRLVVDAEARPEVEICEHSIRLGAPGGGPPAVLSLPLEARPVDLEGAKCTYSRKKRQVVVEWPAPAPRADRDDAEAAAEEADATATASEEPTAPEQPDDSAPPAATEEAAEEAAEAPAEAAAEEVTEALAEEATKEEPADESADEEPAVSADEWKARGNAAVAAGDHAAAAEHYARGLKVEPEHHILLSNRALCLHKLGQLEEALANARRCAALRPDFWKGHLRAGLILRDLGRPAEALEVLRRAGKHEEIEKLSAELRPEVEAAEAERIASLGGPERRKEEGNALFKKGLFEQALAAYNEALELCAGDDASELAISVRNNRAACYHQLSDFSSVVKDTTAVLEQQPDNLKALARRMLALEPLEKHEQALEDARRVLRHCPGHEAANKVQHRLGKLVRDRQRDQRGGA